MQIICPRCASTLSVIVGNANVGLNLNLVNSYQAKISRLRDKEICSGLVVDDESWQVCQSDGLRVTTSLGLSEFVFATGQTGV